MARMRELTQWRNHLWEVGQLGDSPSDLRGDLLDRGAGGVDGQQRPAEFGQASRGVAVEVSFNAASGGVDLEATVRTPLPDPADAHGWVGGEDDREVRDVGGSVERCDELDRHGVHPLQHVGGGDVAVTEHDPARRELGADLGGQVVVAVGGHQAGQGVPGVSVGAVAGDLAEPVVGGLRGDVHGVAGLGEVLVQVPGRGGLTGPADPVEAGKLVEGPDDHHQPEAA
jgi:hypothetical protein